MCTRSKIGPNDYCTCGSNKKYNRCCESIDGSPSKKWKGLLLGVLLTAGALAFVLGSTSQPNGTPSATSGVGPGARSNRQPSGRVWSPEHGHWHNLPSSGSGLGTKLSPQPPGSPPPGKVWSPEHGHWHDVSSSGSGLGTKLSPQPPGSPPPGKVWSPEHGHWHDTQ